MAALEPHPAGFAPALRSPAVDERFAAHRRAGGPRGQPPAGPAGRRHRLHRPGGARPGDRDGGLPPRRRASSTSATSTRTSSGPGSSTPPTDDARLRAAAGCPSGCWALAERRGARISFGGVVAPDALGGPRRRPARPRPASLAEGDRPGHQRPDDQLVRRPVPDPRLGDARLPRATPTRPTSELWRRSGTSSGSTSPTRRGLGGAPRRPRGAGRGAQRHAGSTRSSSRGPGHRADGRAPPLARAGTRATSTTRGGHPPPAEPADRGGVHDARPAAGRRARHRDEAARARATARSSAACASSSRRAGPSRSTPTRTARRCARCSPSTTAPPASARSRSSTATGGSGRSARSSTTRCSTRTPRATSRSGRPTTFLVGEGDLGRINRSRVHIDFMVGSNELEVTGITASGERVPVLAGGDWQL